jgi:sigma-B regulation protein RsbU (phosphoserine phosphatase)
MSKILVIDDDPTIRLVLKKALRGLACQVSLAADGKEGLEKVKELHPDLIICDWMMPVMDGLEVCRQVKAMPELATTFFVLLTARDALEDRIMGLDTGADDFLAKPIEITELQARIRAGLRLHQLAEELQEKTRTLEAELAEAATYVRSLLPTPLIEKVQVDARFIPSQQLGGDCFDYRWLDPDYLMIYLLDVSGHGLGAALPSISILNLLRSQSLPDVNFYQPHDILRALNEIFQMNDQNDKYFTIWYGVYNHVRRQLTYACGGHPPAILVVPTANGQVEALRLKTPGLPVGMLDDTKFVSDRQDIPPGSTLYIFSDGIFDFNQVDDRNQWGLDSLIEILTKAHVDQLDLDTMLDMIRQVSGVETFEDDLSLLKIKFD